MKSLIQSLGLLFVLSVSSHSYAQVALPAVVSDVVGGVVGATGLGTANLGDVSAISGSTGLLDVGVLQGGGLVDVSVLDNSVINIDGNGLSVLGAEQGVLLLGAPSSPLQASGIGLMAEPAAGDASQLAVFDPIFTDIDVEITDGACRDLDKDGVCDTQDLCPATPAQSPVLADGCHLQLGKLRALRGVLFFRADAMLRPESIDRLDNAVQVLLRYPSLPVAIVADSSRDVNLAHSRARSVRDYFIENGINPNRLQVRTQSPLGVDAGLALILLEP